MFWPLGERRFAYYAPGRALRGELLAAGSCPKCGAQGPIGILGNRYASDALCAAGCNAEIKLDPFTLGY